MINVIWMRLLSVTAFDPEFPAERRSCCDAVPETLPLSAATSLVVTVVSFTISSGSIWPIQN